MKDHNEERRASLRQIFVRATGVLLASLGIILSVAVLTNIQARNAVKEITELEQRILFPLSRAVEEIYEALMELNGQTVQLDASAITADYFNSQLANARANLDVALRAISDISDNQELLVPITETTRLAQRFERIGSEAIEVRRQTLELKKRLLARHQEVLDRIRKLQDYFSAQLLSIKTNAPERAFFFQAINDLTAIKNALVELQACVEHTIGSLNAMKHRGLDCAYDPSDVEFLLESVMAAAPEKAEELALLKAPLAEISSLEKHLLQKAASTVARSEKASELAEELAMNLELCRQSVATINEHISSDANELFMTLLVLLIGSIAIYLVVAAASLGWLKRQLLDPLASLSSSVTDLGRGKGRIEIPRSSIHELHLLTRQLQLMSNRLYLRERKIREARRQWEAIFKAIGGPAFILSPALEIMECNRLFMKILGAQEPGNVLGRQCWQVICRQEDGEGNCPLHAMDLDRFDRPMTFERRINGVPYLFTASPAHDPEGRLEKIIVVGADLSEVKALERKLQRAQKMEALGTLAGGVAHDLNNILTGIVTYPDMLLMQLPEDSPLRRPISIVKSSGERAAAVVQDLLALARRSMEVKKVVNLNEVIEEYLETAEYRRLTEEYPDIEVLIELDQHLLNIEGSPVHLMKMVMNLVTNAAEAISGAGTIKIATANVFLDRPVAGYDVVEQGEYVRLTIEDDGSGISPEDLPHIFEPFYTKKVMGRSGSGLGMAVVWGTVKDHKGYIDVHSTPGVGTKFNIYLPVTRRAPQEDPKESLDAEAFKGQESILVVDDMEQQRQIAADILSRLGYRVDVAESGEEAVRMSKEQCYDLLVLDMIMDPGMDGLDTYKEISTICPGQKAIITSGYSETERVRMALEMGVATYVKKPYSMVKLAEAVRKALDGEGPEEMH